MRVALVQTSLHWENPIANRLTLESKILSCPKKFDLLILPEMFTSGFTMNPERVAETMDGESILWLKSLAKSKKTAITGSLVIEEEGNYYNRLVFVFPDGAIQYYNKRHLFTLAGEEEVYTKGEKKLVVEYKDWKICPLICYDLRFPVFARNIENYDLLVYVANWPKPRIQAWDALLKARAIENMCYVAAVNRIGSDANGMPYVGHSQVIDELGNEIVAPFEEDAIKVITLDKKKVTESRNKFNFLKDKDVFEIKRDT
ncbi:nitrilase family protein [Flavobacterium sp. NRK F10]|uniref:nitrilase family protein n=1 Tax=Flavobacterium sp. NRK F10 TaxID=2954931 RepID=UPI0020904A13|nr:nitrilase family protein [Flavobacterium sp. NRK F10]MCO6174586.1 nitrilase family protein [Flavobacterium sp. NRK F10]